MSILDLRTDDALAGVPDYIAPRPVEKRTNWGDVATAIPRAMGQAGLEVLATGAEIAAGLRYIGNATPEQRRMLDAGGMPAGGAQSDLADSLRERGRSFRPDPETASTAEQLLYGFARGASKIVAGAVAAGPVGIVAAGLEEANTQFADLTDQGVPRDAAIKAGLVQGAGLGLAALPLVGQTLKQTAALYVAGGPGAYVAQQALTRDILQNAGQDKIAAQYDPFDPLGLAVASLVPAAFAGYAIRGQRIAAAARAAEEFRTGPVPSSETATAAAARAYSPEVVDAARVAYAVDRRQAAKPYVFGRDDSHEAAMQRAEEAMARGEPVNASDLVTARTVESLPAFLAREKIKAEPMPPEVKGDFLAFIRASGGIDFGQKLDITGESSGVRVNPGGIFRRGGRSTDELAMLAEEAGYLRPGEGTDSGRFVEMVQQAARGERVLTFAEQMQAAARDQQVASMAERLQDVERRLRLIGVDPAPANGNVAALEAYARQNEPAILAAALDEARAADEFSPEFEAMRQQARDIARDMADGGRTLEQYEAEVRPLSPVLRRLVSEEASAPRAEAPNPEAAAPARGAEPPPADPAAGGAGQAARLTPGETAEAGAMAMRLADAEAQFPELLVQMDDMDSPMRLADFLAATKREADEMLADAPLMEIAAQCAILNGQ